jgi:hypothetical protein
MPDDRREEFVIAVDSSAQVSGEKARREYKSFPFVGSKILQRTRPYGNSRTAEQTHQRDQLQTVPTGIAGSEKRRPAD